MKRWIYQEKIPESCIRETASFVFLAPIDSAKELNVDSSGKQETSAVNIEGSATSPALSVFALTKWEAFTEVVAQKLPKNFVLDSELLKWIDVSLTNPTFETCPVILETSLPEVCVQAEPSLAMGLIFHFNIIRRSPFSVSEKQLAEEMVQEHPTGHVGGAGNLTVDEGAKGFIMEDNAPLCSKKR